MTRYVVQTGDHHDGRPMFLRTLNVMESGSHSATNTTDPTGAYSTTDRAAAEALAAFLNARRLTHDEARPARAMDVDLARSLATA